MQAGRDAEKDLEMCEAATDGPWHTQPDGQYSLAIVSLPEQEVICFTDSFGAGVHDGRFVAEARTALPHWIQRALAVEAALHWYADQNNYSIPHLGCAPKVMADRGKRAHDILKELGVI